MDIPIKANEFIYAELRNTPMEFTHAITKEAVRGPFQGFLPSVFTKIEEDENKEKE